MYIEATLIPKI